MCTTVQLYFLEKETLCLRTGGTGTSSRKDRWDSRYIKVAEPLIDINARCKVFDTSTHGHGLKHTLHSGVLLLSSAPIRNYRQLLNILTHIEKEEEQLAFSIFYNDFRLFISML